MGRPCLWMGFEPGFSIGRPCDGPGCAASADPSMSFARLVLRIGVEAVREVGVRYVGLDVHRDFCEVAMLEQGVFVACGRVDTTPEALAVFARA